MTHRKLDLLRTYAAFKQSLATNRSFIWSWDSSLKRPRPPMTIGHLQLALRRLSFHPLVRLVDLVRTPKNIGSVMPIVISAAAGRRSLRSSADRFRLGVAFLVFVAPARANPQPDAAAVGRARLPRHDEGTLDTKLRHNAKLRSFGNPFARAGRYMTRPEPTVPDNYKSVKGGSRRICGGLGKSARVFLHC